MDKREQDGEKRQEQRKETKRDEAAAHEEVDDKSSGERDDEPLEDKERLTEPKVDKREETADKDNPARLASSVIRIPFAARILRMLFGKMISSCAIIDSLRYLLTK